ncbi:MAG: hypothetical protein ABR910_10015 [Acidobacteriaceae bacterium]|jgi:hypothetical protein
MTTYKIFFHAGEELGLKTRVEKGNAIVDETSLRIDGPSGVVVPLKDINAVKLFRLHGLGRVIQIDHSHGRLFVSVVRFMIGQFATINFFKTGKLHAILAAATNNDAP